ncbi:TPA: DcrB-related protein [Proteus mirabilis]
MNNESRCVFSEGSVLLPDGYKEQTINILISPTGHAVNISRDDKAKDLSFEEYILNQKALLQRSLKEWQLLEEKPSMLGARSDPRIFNQLSLSPQQKTTSLSNTGRLSPY